MKGVVVGCVILLVLVVTTLIVVGVLDSRERKFNENVVTCLFEKQARLYTLGESNPYLEKQKDKFRRVSVQEFVIDCSINNASMTACNEWRSKFKIAKWPVWQIGTKYYEGVLTPERLWRVASCDNTNVSQTQNAKQ